MRNYDKLRKCARRNKLIIFGAGNMGRSAYLFCKRVDIQPFLFMDNDVRKAETFLEGVKVLLPSTVFTDDVDYVFLIASQYVDEIEEQLAAMNVSQNRIFSFSDIAQEINAVKEKKEQVIYYPIFDNSEELTSHYYRACWYLPRANNCLDKVLMFADKCTLLSRPDYMGSSNVPSSHIIITEETKNYKNALEKSKVVLVWSHIQEEEKLELELTGCKVVNVNTEDDDAKEYGRYCSLIWNFFKTENERKNIIKKSYDTFCSVADQIKKKNLHIGCVFGTGPSLESSYEFDFSNCFCVVCNSIVQNRDLLHHINPVFVTAGDVVSHLGVSLYAEVFRKDLIDYLLNSEAYFLTTAAFGYLLTEQCSAIENKIILVEQLLDTQNYDLIKQFALPKLDSTLNIHMLPLVHTFCDKIYINGCDGKCPDVNNEDFWAHAETAQYLELVETGHKCHPSFDRNRQKNTYTRYQDSTLMSIECGEKEHGKTYYTLKKSYIKALKNREITYTVNSQYNMKDQLIISSN